LHSPWCGRHRTCACGADQVPISGVIGAEAQRTRLLVVALLAVAVAAGGFLGWRITRSITAPIHSAVDALASVH
jgi:hypothetical protein